MALIDNCLVYSTLNDAGSITIPDIGGPGVITGALNYAAAKYDDGVIASAHGANYFYLPITFASNNEILIDTWIKPTTNKAGIGTEEALFGIWFANNTVCWVHMDTSGIDCIGYDGGALKWNITDAGTTWNANDLIHIAMIIDKNAGFDGAKTVAVYVNGVQTVSSTNVFNFTSAWTRMHVLSYFSGTDRVNNKVYVDNIKAYDNGSSILADVLANRNNEGWPVAGGFRLLDGGLKPPPFAGVIN